MATKIYRQRNVAGTRVYQSLTPPYENANSVTPQASALLIGARSRSKTGTEASDYAYGESVLGPLQITRTYYPGAVGGTYDKRLSPGDMISFKGLPANNSAGNASLQAFLDSLSPGDRLLYHHEPEGFVTIDGVKTPEYASGADYVAEFTTVANRIHALKPDAKVGHSAGGFQYSSKGRGYDGSFIPPPTVCDFYGFDSYQDSTSATGYGSIKPIQDDARFARWYSLVEPYHRLNGKELHINEYGRGVVGLNEVSDTPARRAAVIPLDYAWLKAAGFVRWSYWFSNVGPDGRQWQFTDAASMSAWSALPRGGVV